MQAVIKMIRFLYKMAIRLVVIYAVFVGLVWLLLGQHPKETWSTSKERVNTFFIKATGFADDTADVAGQMGQVAQKRIDSAKDRFHGIDPYEGYNEKLSGETKEVQ